LAARQPPRQPEPSARLDLEPRGSRVIRTLTVIALAMLWAGMKDRQVPALESWLREPSH